MIVKQLHAAFSGIVFSWEEAKLFIEHAVFFSEDSLHVIAGVLVLLGAAAIVRKPISSIWPWLIVLVLTCLNEFSDLWIQQWPHPGMQYGESARDLLLTLALPTLLMLSVRFAPRLYQPPRRR